MAVLAYLPGTSAWRHRRAHALCMRVRDHIHELVDGEFEPGRLHDRLIRHLEACVHCGPQAEAVRQLKIAVARVGQQGTDDEVVARLREVARQLRDEPEGFTD